MTAIEGYQRIEVIGLWRADADSPAREVIVSLGEASLTLCDVSDGVLAHWSLAAVLRAENKGDCAVYYPDGAPSETLTLNADAEVMVTAIDRIRAAIVKRRPHTGRVRLWLTGLIVLGVTIGAVVWLPGAVVRYTAQILPMAQRAAIGADVLHAITQTTDPACRNTAQTPEGLHALQALSVRLLGDADALLVASLGPVPSLRLPGGQIVLNHSVIAKWDAPDVAAGFVLAEAAHQDTAAADTSGTTPMLRLLQDAGPLASARLLVAGRLPDAPLTRHAQALLRTPQPPAPTAAVIARFASAEVATTPYAQARLAQGAAAQPFTEQANALIAQDPYPTGARTVLNDAEWLRLRGICTP